MKRFLSILICIFCSLAFPAFSQEQPDLVSDQWLQEHYTKRDVQIPMRDGVKLYTTLYEPLREAFNDGKVDFTNGRPVLMLRTPYGTKPYGEKFNSDLNSNLRNFVRNGYIIVFQSVRGTYMSEGTYQNVRPFNPNKSITPGGGNQTDEGSDTYDTAEWLIHNTASNGNIGVKGVSYPGFYATLAGMSGHPAVKAISPQAPVTDWFIGDDIRRNGAIFLADLCGFGGSFFRTRSGITQNGMSGLIVPDKSLYDFYKGRAISDILEPIDTLQYLKDVISHPDYDSFWTERNPTTYIKSMRSAVLIVGGLYDAEDYYGALATFRAVYNKCPKVDSYLALGPWFHGGWRDLKYNHLDGAYFGYGSANYFIDKIEYPFFAYYLEGKGEKPAKVNVLPSEETEKALMENHRTEGDWVSSESWPIKGVKFRKLYLQGDKTVSFSKPEATTLLTYTSDPSNPVPFYHENLDGRGKEYMTGDQTFASLRNDVLSFTGATLTDTVTVAGPLKVNICFSSTGTDADIIVKLIDVRPDGYQMLIRADIMPARYRDGFVKAEPLKPGKKYSVKFTMNDIFHSFVPGHKMMVQVQSSWFPLAAMNPQSFVKNQFKAVKSDYVSADMTVFCGRKSGSFVELPILNFFGAK